MANNIVPIQSQSDFLAFIRDQAMSNGNLSIRGVARCCDVHHSTLQDALSSVAGKVTKTLTQHGFDVAGIIENGFPPQAVWLCIEYYAFESRAKAPMAKQLARTFGAIGVMATLKELNAPAVAFQAPQRDPIEYIEAAKTLENLKDPLMRSLLSQRLYEVLQGQSALPGTADRLVCVAVRAGELGFRLGQGEDSLLGKYIKARFQPEGQLPHGRYQVNAYKLTPQLDEAIRSFFYALSGEN